MLCPRCKSEILSKDAAYCQRCGALLSDNLNQRNAANNLIIQSPLIGSGKRRWWLPAIIIAVVILGSASYFILGSLHREPLPVLAYSSQGNIYLAKFFPKGKGYSVKTAIAVTGQNYLGTWSPNGRYLAFLSNTTWMAGASSILVAGRPEILDVDSRKVYPVFLNGLPLQSQTDFGLRNLDFVWSPDSKTLIASSSFIIPITAGSANFTAHADTQLAKDPTWRASEFTEANNICYLTWKMDDETGLPQAEIMEYNRQAKQSANLAVIGLPNGFVGSSPGLIISDRTTGNSLIDINGGSVNGPHQWYYYAAKDNLLYENVSLNTDAAKFNATEISDAVLQGADDGSPDSKLSFAYGQQNLAPPVANLFNSAQAMPLGERSLAITGLPAWNFQINRVDIGSACWQPENGVYYSANLQELLNDALSYGNWKKASGNTIPN